MASPQTGGLERVDRGWLFGILILTLVIFAPYLLPQPAPLIFPQNGGTDLIPELWSLAYYIRDSLQETGRFPLWRPYVLSGAPLVGHPLAPIAYPPHWLVLVLPLPLAFNVDALLHLLWAGLTMYCCLRQLYQLRPSAAFVGAMVYAHAPRFFAHLASGHWTTIVAVAWFPAIWLCFSLYWETRQRCWAVLLGAALAMVALNDGRYLLMDGIVLVGAVLSRIERQAVGSWLRKCLSLALIALPTMIALSAVQILPMLELLPQTNRLSMISEAWQDPWLLLYGFGILFPIHFPIAEYLVYPGLLALLMLLYGVLAGWSRRERGWFTALVMLLILNMGESGGLFTLLINIVPGLSALRGGLRFWPLALFALTVLASLGANKWFSGYSARRLNLFLCIICILYIGGTVAQNVLGEGFFYDAQSRLIFLVILGLGVSLTPKRWRIVMVFIGVFELWTVNWTWLHPQPESELLSTSALTQYLIDHTAADERIFAPYGQVMESELLPHQLFTADGYDSVQLARYATFMRLASGCDYQPFSVGVPPTRASAPAVNACPQAQFELDLLALVNARWVILPYALEDRQPVLVDQGRYLYDFEAGMGRAFGIPTVETVSASQCFTRLQEIDVREVALVEQDQQPNRQGLITLIDSQRIANGELFHVRAESGGLLIRSETDYPAWHAEVDGSPVEVVRVNCVLQGVWIPAGEHVVRFEFRSTFFEVGLWISLVACATLILIGIRVLMFAQR
jgi:hypothetical protein